MKKNIISFLTFIFCNSTAEKTTLMHVETDVQCSIYLLHDKLEIQGMNDAWRLEGVLAQDNSLAMN